MLISWRSCGESRCKNLGGPRASRFIQSARQFAQLRKLAQIAKPTAAQRATILRLKKSLGDKAKDIKIKYRQTPKDEIGTVVKKTTGADDVLKTNRPGSDGSATVRGSARTWVQLKLFNRHHQHLQQQLTNKPRYHFNE